jgi:glucokinase
MILAGDIGGTSARLGLFELVDGLPVLRAVEKYSSRDHPGLEPILQVFRAAHPAPLAGACIGVAGPVVGTRVQTPNLPWVVESAQLAAALNGAPVWLINDLEANAFGVAALGPADFVDLNPGAAGDPAGNAAIISAGTGLGEAGFYSDGQRLRPFACEGGHATFAPLDDLQAALAAHLRGKFGHVSVERVLSGPGLVEIYDFLGQSGRGAVNPALAAIPREELPGAIAQRALAGECPTCGAAVDIFVRVYGAEAANLALKLKATRAVYVGGGIAPRLLPKLQAPAFREAFLDKGRMRALLEPVPVRLILNDDAALLGAALAAALRSGRITHPWLQA